MRRKLLFTSFLLSVAAGALMAWLMGRPLSYTSAELATANTPMMAVETNAAPPSDMGAGTPNRDASVEDAAAEPDAAALPPLPAVVTRRARTPPLDGTDNYLLLGLDRTHGEWGRADTILVAIFDRNSNHAGVVSIPRDLYVHIPGHGPARVNATLRIAARLGEDPLEMMKRVLSDTLAMPIAHIVTGDLQVFERAVDEVGGVSLDVPCALSDDFIDERTASGRRVLEVGAGMQHFDGVTAAMYARSRHGRSDWDRARRQQALLFALKRRLRELGPSAILPLLGRELFRGVHSDMSRLQMMALARRVSRLRRDKLHGLVLGYRQMSSYRTPEGHAVQVPDFNAIDDALSGLFDAPAPGQRPARARCREVDAALHHHL